MHITVVSKHDLYDTRIKKHISTLLNAGHTVHYINVSPQADHDYTDEALTLTHIPILLAGSGWRRLPYVIRKIKNAIRAVPSDIVHIHDPQLLFVLPFAKGRGSKVVYDRHEFYERFGSFTARLGMTAELAFRKSIDAVVYTARAQKEYLRKHHFSKSVYIPNYQEQRPLLDDGVKTSESSGVISFVYIGSLEEYDRNILLMLRAMKRILQQYPNTSFTLGGKTNDRRVSEMIRRMQCLPGFQYIGPVSHERVESETEKADVGLLLFKDKPDADGSSTNKLYEYIQGETAIVTMGRYEDIDLVQDRLGIVMPFDCSENELVSWLSRFITDRSFLTSCQGACRPLKSTYCWEKVAGKYLRLYDRLLR